jgi:PQQ-dependent dehydrogenase (methanol/ethanol family)
MLEGRTIGRLHILAVVVGAFLVLAAPVFAASQGTAKTAIAPIVLAPAFQPADLGVYAGADWPTIGGDYQGDRYSTLNQITTANVSSLKEAWHIHLGSGTGTQYRGEATPLVYKGVMYMVTGNDDVFALDAATGAQIWSYHSSLPLNLTNICCGWDARGVAIGEGRVYLAQLDGKLVALNQQDGTPLWSATNGRFQEGQTMTMAPLYYNGLVIVGISGSEQGVRGHATAYDAKTGRRVWRFYNVPTPGDIGSGTWPNNSEWQVGGATLWNTPTVDPATNTLVYTTANTDPWSGRGPGDNLFTASFVGLDALSGDYRWHFQVVHHDIWDYDCPSPTVMFDAVVGGSTKKAVAEPCKTGWLYIVDRATGNPLTQIDEKPVPQNEFNNTSLTQPIPVGDAFAEQCPKASDFPATAPDGKPYIVGCIWQPYDDQQFVGTAPGAGGGSVVSNSSFNPNTGLFYIISANTRLAIKGIPNASSLYRNGRSFTGRQGGATATGFQTTGDLTAMRVQNNRIAWKQHYTPQVANATNAFQSAQTGTMTTAGNLVFAGIPGGVAWGIIAYNATTGAEVWRSATDAAAEAGPMTYSVNGKQYVAIYIGGRNTTTAPNTHGDSVYAYALG